MTTVGYEIPINRHFYVCKPARQLAENGPDVSRFEGDIAQLLKGVVA
jgi:type I restriction enzyme M protein